jgi:hypothetical protein
VNYQGSRGGDELVAVACRILVHIWKEPWLIVAVLIGRSDDTLSWSRLIAYLLYLTHRYFIFPAILLRVDEVSSFSLRFGSSCCCCVVCKHFPLSPASDGCLLNLLSAVELCCAASPRPRSVVFSFQRQCNLPKSANTQPTASPMV